MNYRHIYHAGNFADVVKHVVLARIIEYLAGKEKPFRVIDTHAGTGHYELSSKEAGKTAEWRSGIQALLEADLPPHAAALIEPYLRAVRAVNAPGEIKFYPGSPLIARQLLRRQDRLTAIELHPADAASLKARFAGDHQVRTIALDGWLALGAHVPPKEKRGVVLVDPPFELAGDYDRIIDGLARAFRRWPGGIYMLWYPIKDRPAVEAFRQALQRTAIADILDIGLDIGPPSGRPRLQACGVAVVNAPYTLEAQMHEILPLLAGILGGKPGATWSVEEIGGNAKPAGAA